MSTNSARDREEDTKETGDLRAAAISVCRAFLKADDVTDKDIRRVKLALTMWATIAKEAQTASAIAAVNVALARELAPSREALASFIRATRGADEPLAQLATTVQTHALPERLDA